MAAVAYRMAYSGRVRITVWNAALELVAELDDWKGEGPQTSALTVATYATGVYFYRVRLDYDGGASEQLPIKRFVVAR